MILTGDYHTHTTYSHGKGSVLENARAAKAAGLQTVGITDHGFAHPAFGLRARKIPLLRRDAEAAEKETGVRVLVGVESNIVSEDGACDLKPARYDDFDLFLAGMHQFVLYDFKTFFKFFVPDFTVNLFKGKPSKGLIKENTKTLINVIKKCPVDVITHLNFRSYTDPVEVAKAAADYGTYLELNAKKEHLTDEELYAVLKTGVRFLVDSDAHTPDRVGEISRVEAQIARTNFPVERIDNVDGRSPDFRFARFKGEAGR